MDDREHQLTRPPIVIDAVSGPFAVHVEGVFNASRVTYTTTVNGEVFDEQAHAAVSTEVQAALRLAKFYELTNMLMGRGELTEALVLDMHTKAFPAEKDHSRISKEIFKFCVQGRIIELLLKDDILAAGRVLLSVEAPDERTALFADIARRSVRSAGLLLERFDLLVPADQYVSSIFALVTPMFTAAQPGVPLTALFAVFSDAGKSVRLFVQALQHAALTENLLKVSSNDDLVRYLCLGSDSDREVIFSALSRERIVQVLELMVNGEKKLRILSGYVAVTPVYFPLLSPRAAAAVLDALTTATDLELIATLDLARQVAIISEMWNPDKSLLLLEDAKRAERMSVPVLARIWERADKVLLPRICAAWDPVLVGKVLVAMDRTRVAELQDRKIVSREFVEQAFKALSPS